MSGSTSVPGARARARQPRIQALGATVPAGLEVNHF